MTSYGTVADYRERLTRWDYGDRHVAALAIIESTAHSVYLTDAERLARVRNVLDALDQVNESEMATP